MIITLSAITAGVLASGGWRYYRNQESEETESPVEESTTENASATEEEMASAGQSGLTELVDKVTEPIKRVGERLREPKDDSPELLLVWAREESGSKALAAWLSGLPPEVLAALTQSIANFCTDLGIDLRWLLERQLDRDPELKEKVTDIVMDHISTCRQGVSAWHDIHVFTTLKQIETDLANKKHRAATSELYTQLVESHLAEPAPAELLLGTDGERRDYVAAQIQHALQTNREAFKKVLSEMLMPPTPINN